MALAREHSRSLDFDICKQVQRQRFSMDVPQTPDQERNLSSVAEGSAADNGIVDPQLTRRLFETNEEGSETCDDSAVSADPRKWLCGQGEGVLATRSGRVYAREVCLAVRSGVCLQMEGLDRNAAIQCQPPR